MMTGQTAATITTKLSLLKNEIIRKLTLYTYKTTIHFTCFSPSATTQSIRMMYRCRTGRVVFVPLRWIAPIEIHTKLMLCRGIMLREAHANA